MEKWRNNKPPILQMAMERNYFITMHHQAGVHFENFTEVKFRDILLTGTGYRDSPSQTGTYGKSAVRPTWAFPGTTLECHERHGSWK